MLKSMNLKSSNWSEAHFNKIILFIRQKVDWANVPQDSTLTDLRHEFYDFACIVISGSFGAFEWKNIDEKLHAPFIRKKKRSVVHSFLLFVSLLPLFGMAYLLWEGTWLKSININANFVALAFFAWALILIDKHLDLGVIDRFVSLGKGLKELR